MEDLRKLDLDMMPGFNVTWFYTVEDYEDRVNSYCISSGCNRMKNYTLDDFNSYYYYRYNDYTCRIGRQGSDYPYQSDTTTQQFRK